MGLIGEAREAFQKGDQQNGAVLWQRGMDEMDEAGGPGAQRSGRPLVRGAVLLMASQYLPDQRRPTL